MIGIFQFINKSKLSLSLSLRKLALRTEEKTETKVLTLVGIAYLKYIFDSFIDKFNIYCVQKCVSRKDLTPERMTIYDTLTSIKF